VKSDNTKLFLDLLYWKQDGSVSHRSFSKLLTTIKEWGQASEIGRENVPDHFDAMLSAMQQAGIQLPYELMWDTCPVCFFVYRGSYKDSDTCGR
jgi:hypothetical protein